MAGRIINSVRDLARQKAMVYALDNPGRPRRIEAYRDGFLAGFTAATQNHPVLTEGVRKALARELAEALSPIESMLERLRR